jgi:outer membrane biosynthesis protein TonB
MKTFILTLSVLVVAQCGVHTRSTEQSPPQANQASTDTQKKQCDFSDYKPLRLRASTLGSPVLSMPQPEYPAEARERKLTGRITVNVLINVNTGVVEQACAADGNEILKRLAEAAALKIRLSPYNDYIRQRYRYAEGVVIYNFVAQ